MDSLSTMFLDGFNTYRRNAILIKSINSVSPENKYNHGSKQFMKNKRVQEKINTKRTMKAKVKKKRNKRF